MILSKTCTKLTHQIQVADVQHHRQADDLVRRVEITERVSIRGGYGPASAGSSRFTLTLPFSIIMSEVFQADKRV